MKRTGFAALAVGVVLTARPATAQDFSSIGSQYIDYGASMMAVGQLNNVLGSTDRSGGRAEAASPVNGAPADTGYRASPEVSARVRARFADFAAKADPANAERLREAIRRQDLLGLWEKHVSIDGLRRGDVADAMTAYWVQNWQMATRTSFVDRARVRAVRGQVARALASNPDFKHLGDAGKQEMAETFMLNFVVQGSAYSDAMTRRDAGLAERLSEAAAARFRREVNIDARQLKLTPAGFARP
jgi:hypothetical protein